jgi:hypothetical protein
MDSHESENGEVIVCSVLMSVARADKESKRCESFVVFIIEIGVLIKRVETADSTC